MKGKLVKRINDNMPSLLKKALMKPIRYKVINNNNFKLMIDEIDSFKVLTNKEKDEIHFDKLKKTLIYAYEHTAFYKEFFDNNKFNPYEFSDYNEFKRLPYIDKKIVIDNFEKLVSDEKVDYYEAFTGGSSGKPLKILLDTDLAFKERAFIYKYWENIGYDYKKSKLLTLRGVEFGNKLYKYNAVDNQIMLNPFKLNNDNILSYVKVIDKFSPEFIHGYPSAIYNMCKILKRNNLKLKKSIKGVFFVSENVEKYEKDFIEEFFNCKSMIFYGHSERAVFAEMFDDSYSFNNLYCDVDLKYDEEENVYKIITTGLLNKKMPLIRYMPDDKVIVNNDKVMIYGHWDKELLIGKNGEKISIASINFHNNIFNKIKLYQFEQFEKGKVVINIVEDEKLTKSDFKLISDELNKKVKDILEYEFNIVNEISFTNRGKFKKIIQHIT